MRQIYQNHLRDRIEEVVINSAEANKNAIPRVLSRL